MSKTSDGCMGSRASLKSGLRGRHKRINTSKTWEGWCGISAWRYLVFIFFFLGESSSEPFLPLPLEPRFSLSPRDSPSVKKTLEHVGVYKSVLLVLVEALHPAAHSLLLFHRCSRNRPLPVSPLTRSQSVRGLHPACGYVCPPTSQRMTSLSCWV